MKGSKSRILSILEDVAGSAQLGPDWIVTPKLSSDDDEETPWKLKGRTRIKRTKKNHDRQR